jgi:hypothetical protein
VEGGIKKKEEKYENTLNKSSGKQIKRHTKFKKKESNTEESETNVKSSTKLREKRGETR